MKRSFSLLLIITLGLLFIGCEPVLLYEEQFPAFNPPADKALCVVIRPSGMYGNLAQIWLDGKTVGATSGNTVTSFEVDPGEHLVITRISIKTKVKLKFEAGKVYYLLQAAFPVPMLGVSTSLTPMPCAEATEKLEQEKGKCKFTRLNPNNTSLENLDDDDVKEELDDWKEWSDDNPEKSKTEIEYSGC